MTPDQIAFQSFCTLHFISVYMSLSLNALPRHARTNLYAQSWSTFARWQVSTALKEPWSWIRFGHVDVTDLGGYLPPRWLVKYPFLSLVVACLLPPLNKSFLALLHGTVMMKRPLSSLTWNFLLLGGLLWISHSIWWTVREKLHVRSMHGEASCTHAHVCAETMDCQPAG